MGDKMELSSIWHQIVKLFLTWVNLKSLLSLGMNKMFWFCIICGHAEKGLYKKKVFHLKGQVNPINVNMSYHKASSTQQI